MFFEYILNRWRWKKSIELSLISTENFKILKYHMCLMKHKFSLLFVVGVAVMMKKYLKEKNQYRLGIKDSWYD